ncbi:MAG TPA: hypothetical protein VMU62_04555 [Acidobacteriaceae bacterium]|nr:hypothetical protein [Acidobacteriaceae bacterium]
MHEPKDIQEPHNDHNDHDKIQDRLNGPCHGNEAINQPEENPNHNQNHEDLNQRHDLLTSWFFEADAVFSAPEKFRMSQRLFLIDVSSGPNPATGVRPTPLEFSLQAKPGGSF